VLKVHSAIEAVGTERTAWHASSSGSVGQARWSVLHPRDSLTAESDNASSLCLLIEYAGRRILLPGDLEGSGLLNLVALPERPCHVLMAPHHGSLSHDPSDLLAWCQPEITVISGNHRATQPRVLQLYSRPESHLGVTFRDGAIQIRIDELGELSGWHWAGDAWAPL
jgi:competence protein ComEC